MPVYVVAQGKIEDRDKLAAYGQKAGPTIAKAGARLLALDETPQVIEGEVATPRTVILEFDSEEAFRAWYDSAEYQEALPLRLDSAPGSLILVKGM